MVSNASDDLPEPDRPVITTSLWRGMSTSIFLRLWTRAPRTAIQSWAIKTGAVPRGQRLEASDLTKYTSRDIVREPLDAAPTLPNQEPRRHPLLLRHARMTPEKQERPAGTAGHLQRSVGFYGLMFVSLGSIIGSGWLLGALNAAQQAGPASVLSWILAACMLALLALVYAELGATYPVAGGSGRFPYYSHGPIAGFTAGWAAWLQAVFIAPIEVLAAITYVNSVGWVNMHFNMINKVGESAGLLNGRGLVVALILMVLFTAINLGGAKFLSDSNSIVVIWKTAVPVLAVVVVAALQFNTANFHAGGGFLPFGFHGVFAAWTGGVVFGLL